MNTLRRYLRLYRMFVGFSLSRSMQFRFDFFFRIVMDLVFYAAHLIFFKVLYSHTATLGGWTEPQGLVFVSVYLVVDAVQMTLTANNLWQLPVLINKGDLDYHLVRPVSSLFLVLFRDFAFNSALNLVAALGILGWAISNLAVPVTATQVAGFGLAIACGSAIMISLQTLSLLPTFWSGDGQGFRQLMFRLDRLLEIPDRLYTGWARRILLSVLPYGVIASFPARLFLDGFSWGVAAHLALVTSGFVFMLIWVWRRGLRVYSSASS